MRRPRCWQIFEILDCVSSGGRARDSRARSSGRSSSRERRSSRGSMPMIWLCPTDSRVSAASSTPGRRWGSWEPAPARSIRPAARSASYVHPPTTGSGPKRESAGAPCGAASTRGGAPPLPSGPSRRSPCRSPGGGRCVGQRVWKVARIGCSTMIEMRILITGITGFVGSHLAEYALERGAEVFGSIRWRSKMEHMEPLRDRVTLIESDLRDLLSVRTVLEQAQPDYIVHLAAQSFVAASWQTPVETFYTNVVSQMHLFEGMRQLGSAARFLVIGSSEEYGLAEPDELPIRETNPLRPLSPYAVSKVAQDLMGWQYYKSYGMHVVRARAFNHTGPRRGDAFSESNFGKQIAEMEAGLREPVVHVGDLKPTRDFSDVRDIVRGYWLLLERGTPGEVYNLCSGLEWSIERLLNFLIEKSTLQHVEIRQDPARLRPSDVPVLRGSRQKIESSLRWP